MIAEIKQIRTIIVDDEQSCIDALQIKLEETCPEVIVSDTCTNIQQAADAIARHDPHLVFLDINMPEDDGFALLEKFNFIPFEIIFVTAFDRFALRAFEFNALNYLLKPVAAQDIVTSVNRYKKRTHSDTSLMQLQSLLHDVRNTQRGIDKIALPTGSGYRFVLIKDIVRLEASSNYTIFYLTDQSQVVVSKTLKEYETMLEQQPFIRIHNSHLINLSLIREYHKGQGGTIVMSDGSEIEVSARRKNFFLEKMEAFMR